MGKHIRIAVVIIALSLAASTLATASPPNGFDCGVGGTAPEDSTRECTCPEDKEPTRGPGDVAMCKERARRSKQRKPVPPPSAPFVEPTPVPPEPPSAKPAGIGESGGPADAAPFPSDVATDAAPTPLPTSTAGPSVPTTDASIVNRGSLSTRRKAAVVLGAAALVSLGTAVILELGGRSAYDRYEDHLREADDETLNDLYDTANRRHLAAQGLAVTGATLGVAVGYLWLTGASSPDSRAVRAAPSITSRSASIAIVGTF